MALPYVQNPSLSNHEDMFVASKMGRGMDDLEHGRAKDHVFESSGPYKTQKGRPAKFSLGRQGWPPAGTVTFSHLGGER
jgi:hypothetical protein